MGEQLQVPGELAFGFAKAFSEALDFAQVRGIEGEDAIRLAQLGLLDDNGFGLVITRFGHLNILPPGFRVLCDTTIICSLNVLASYLFHSV